MDKVVRTGAWVVAALVLCLGRPGWAEESPADAVEGRLILTASYGFLAMFAQDVEGSGGNPFWGHGLRARFGGERCSGPCLGLSASGTLWVAPEMAGGVGVGPHLGLRFNGPAWGGPGTFRLGAAYHWQQAPVAEADSQGQRRVSGRAPAHGVGAWLSLDLQFLKTPAVVSPLIGIQGSYVAMLGDQVSHQLSAQVTLGLVIGRRLVFSDRGAAPGEPSAQEAEEETDDAYELSPDDERRLQEAEEDLRSPVRD